MTEAGRTPEEMRQGLIQRSVEDEELRQRLLDDPKATVEQELGTPLPEEVEVRTVEETPDTVYLVLPPKAEAPYEGSELSDQELESVAGGWDFSSKCHTNTDCSTWSGCGGCVD
ncbi:MAG: NHLP leader peptide family RiPP precursor [Rubrobacteraceae bacterium]